MEACSRSVEPVGSSKPVVKVGLAEKLHGVYWPNQGRIHAIIPPWQGRPSRSAHGRDYCARKLKCECLAPSNTLAPMDVDGGVVALVGRMDRGPWPEMRRRSTGGISPALPANHSRPAIDKHHKQYSQGTQAIPSCLEAEVAFARRANPRLERQYDLPLGCLAAASLPYQPWYPYQEGR